MEKATLRGMHGAWISPVGEVAKVASLYGHADVIESLMKGLKINNADDYNKAYDKQFARVVNTPDTIYITTTKPLSSSQKASAELMGIVNEKRVILENPNNGKQSTLYSVVRFQPDPSMPSVLNGSNGTRIIKSNSGKFRVYSGTGALLGIRDTQQAAEKLAAKP